MFNARSLRNKLPDLHLLLASNQYSIIFISESWLCDDISDAMLIDRFPYSVHRYDRTYCNGGGCCILISNSIKCNRIKFAPGSQHQLVQSRCEIICLDVCHGCDKFRLVLIYRPPSSSLNGSNSSLISSLALSNLLTIICDVQHSCIVLGDLNLPNVNWMDHSSTVDHSIDCLLDFFSNHGFVQFVNQSTRIGYRERAISWMLC